MEVRELRAKVTALHEEAKTIKDVATEDKRELSQDETKRIDALLDVAEMLNKQITGKLIIEMTPDRLAQFKAAGMQIPKGITTPARYVPPQHVVGGGSAQQSWGVANHQEDLLARDSGGFESFGSYLTCVAAAFTKGRYDDRLAQFDTSNGQISAAQSSDSGSEGGFLVPDLFRAELEISSRRRVPWLDLIETIQVEGNNLVIPVLGNADESAGKTAAVSLSRTQEGDTITTDTYTLKSLSLRLSTAASLIEVPNVLLDASAISMDRVVGDIFAQQIALTRARDFLTGSGAGEPKGVLTGSDLTTVSTSTGSADLQYEDVCAMRERLEPGGGDTAVWLAHPSTYSKIAVFEVSGNPVWNANTTASGGFETLLGLPLFFTDGAKVSVGTVGDIVLANLNQYRYIQDRQGPVIDVSTHLRFDKNTTIFRLRLNDDGAPWRNSQYTDLASFNLSNNVALATR